MEPNDKTPAEYGNLEQRLGYVFRQPERLAAALTHGSHAAEQPEPGPVENQRLEFLGDAVLGAVAAEWLVAQRMDWREGTLTKVRSRLTNETALERVARRLDLGSWLRLGRGEERGGGREKRAVLADALEAVIGAIWLDGGPEAVRSFFINAFAEEIEQALEAGDEDNPKGALQYRMQRECKENPRYEVMEESGPAHLRHFRVAVFRGDDRLGEGTGVSKREAEMHAAREALGSMDPQGGE